MNSKIITLKELKLMVNDARGVQTPSAKQLLESDIKIVVKAVFGKRESMYVFQNGFVLYLKDEYSVVFRVHECKEYTYKFCKGSSVVPVEEFENIDWEIRLLLTGMDRLMRNNAEREKYHIGKEKIGESCEIETASETKINLKKLRKIMHLVLTAKQLEIMEMHYFDNCSYSEISKKLGISKSTINERIKGSIKKIKKYLQKYPNDSI